MPRSTTACSHHSYALLVLACFTVSITATTPLLGQESDAGTARRSGQRTRAERFEANIAELRRDMNELRAKLRAAMGATRRDLEREMATAKRELGKLYDEWQESSAEDVKVYETALTDTWAKFRGANKDIRLMIGEELEAARAQWNASSAQLQKAHRLEVEQLRAELTMLEAEESRVSDDIIEIWTKERTQIRKEYEIVAMEMRAAYLKYIESLVSEIKQLRAAAREAGSEAHVAYHQQADMLTKQFERAYDELHENYEDLLAKGAAYAAQTQSKLSTFSAQAREDIGNELDAVATTMCDALGQLSNSYATYSKSLAAEAKHVAKRMAASKGRAKARLKKQAEALRAKAKIASKDSGKFFESYVAALRKEIARLNEEAHQAMGPARAELDQQLAKRQAQLDEALKQAAAAQDN